MCCFLIIRHLGDAALYQHIEWASVVCMYVLKTFFRKTKKFNPERILEI